ncbi:MAG TPA: 50S ribosomal protein L11 methyltransferase [Candidatus Binatia bacterium]
MPSSWLQLSVRADPSAFDGISNFLIERGSPGVVIRKRELQAYFVNSAENGSLNMDVRRFLQGISGIYPEGGIPRIRWRVIKDRNWNSSWHRFFTPQKIGKSFWVTTPWIAPPLLRRRHVITIEPGMAFGTGTHATTRGCLEFIEKVAPSFHERGVRVLDVGTGSGILAIALAKSGAKRVLAVDVDPLALKVARANLRYNGVQKKVHLSGAKLSRIKTRFPVVVANLTAETIIDQAMALEKRVAPRGFLILSGILYQKTKQVVKQFVGGFKVIRRKREKEWVTLLLRRR